MTKQEQPRKSLFIQILTKLLFPEEGASGVGARLPKKPSFPPFEAEASPDDEYRIP